MYFADEGEGLLNNWGIDPGGFVGTRESSSFEVVHRTIDLYIYIYIFLRNTSKKLAIFRSINCDAFFKFLNYIYGII